jgi:hypothetical protein
MKDKCEWKDGEIDRCSGYRLVFNFSEKRYNYCEHCGADIRKPKPEVIIKKSGETWVARYKGVDYLCVLPDGYSDLDKGIIMNPITVHPCWWKPISEIEITDEIAKLRPMVMDGNCHEKLYAVDNGTFVTDEDRTDDNCYSLATIDDLN